MWADPTIAAFENNPATLSELFAAHFWAAAYHLGTPDVYDLTIEELVREWVIQWEIFYIKLNEVFSTSVLSLWKVSVIRTYDYVCT